MQRFIFFCKGQTYHVKVKTQTKNQELIFEKHRRIAQASAPLFIKKGFNQTSIREVADASKMSVGLLYKYISTKDDVLFLVYKELHDQYFSALTSVNAEEKMNPIKKLKASMEVMLKLIQNDRKKYLFLYTESKFLRPLALKSILSLESRVIEHFEKIIKEGVVNGSFDVKDSFLTANIAVFFLMIDPLRGWSYRKKYGQSFPQEYLVNFCLKSILKVKTPL